MSRCPVYVDILFTVKRLKANELYEYCTFKYIKSRALAAAAPIHNKTATTAAAVFFVLQTRYNNYNIIIRKILIFVYMYILGTVPTMANDRLNFLTKKNRFAFLIIFSHFKNNINIHFIRFD